MHLIGINGFKRSGKGTVADIVAAIYADGNANVKGVGFADKLKVLAALSLGFSRARSDAELIALMDEAKERWIIDIRRAPGPLSPHSILLGVNCAPYHELTGREYLQHMGNNAREVFGDTFWIDQVLPHPTPHTPGMTPATHNAANQSRLFKRYRYVDCLCITDLRYENEAQRIKALGGTVWEVLRPGTASDGHASEQPLPRHLVDRQIDNSSDMPHLEREVERAMDKL